LTEETTDRAPLPYALPYPLYYSPAYVGAGYAFETTRKAGWVAESLAASPVVGVEVVAPEPLTGEAVARVHDAGYVRAVRTGEPRSLAESQGFDWDAGLFPMALASNGGMVAAARAARENGVAGSLSSGLHHARRESGYGYCTFNGLALAAFDALERGARAVLIVDLDAHCGGGTHSLVAHDPRVWQVDVATSGFDAYDSSERMWLFQVRRADEYLPTVERLLDGVSHRKIPFDLCLYNAGMDPYEDCGTGGLAGVTREILAERERLVFDWCRARELPVAYALAGGYLSTRLDRETLVALHRLTLAAARGW
jgi:acetoin utilization deacetylase AcuC-like enzyme